MVEIVRIFTVKLTYSRSTCKNGWFRDYFRGEVLVLESVYLIVLFFVF